MVLDSFGCGGAADAGKYGDAGADTLGHIAAACSVGKGNGDSLRQGPLHLPNLAALGLGATGRASTGLYPPGLEIDAEPTALWGYGIEQSAGKDTPSGHWELAGTIVPFAFGYFEPGKPAFPRKLVEDIVIRGQLPGILGDCHASGIAIIEELGEDHIATGKPILYTSVDSVLQIAAHENYFGLERLYDLCVLVREIVNPLHIGRVIARPFIGSDRSNFRRTPRRKDYSLQPPHGNILDQAAIERRDVASIGKIGDIFAHRNTGKIIKADDDMGLFDAMLEQWKDWPDGGLMFANFVDLDTDFGHRRNIAGYAAGLELFDRRLTELSACLQPDDLVIFTADHGNDPSWHGTDHTREHVPILAYGPNIQPGPIGARNTFADVGATIANHLNLPATPNGTSFI